MEATGCLRLVGLDEHGVGLKLLNKLLGSLGQHGRLVGRADQIDFLAVEALGQVDEGSVEAVLSIIRRTRSFKTSSMNHRSCKRQTFKLNTYLSPTLS